MLIGKLLNENYSKSNVGIYNFVISLMSSFFFVPLIFIYIAGISIAFDILESWRYYILLGICLAELVFIVLDNVANGAFMGWVFYRKAKKEKLEKYVKIVQIVFIVSKLFLLFLFRVPLYFGVFGLSMFFMLELEEEELYFRIPGILIGIMGTGIYMVIAILFNVFLFLFAMKIVTSQLHLSRSDQYQIKSELSLIKAVTEEDEEEDGDFNDDNNDDDEIMLNTYSSQAYSPKNKEEDDDDENTKRHHFIQASPDTSSEENSSSEEVKIE